MRIKGFAELILLNTLSLAVQKVKIRIVNLDNIQGLYMIELYGNEYRQYFIPERPPEGD